MFISLFLSGCYFITKPAKLDYVHDRFGLNFPEDTKYFTAHNIWYEDPMNIGYINYPIGKIIPYGNLKSENDLKNRISSFRDALAGSANITELLLKADNYRF